MVVGEWSWKEESDDIRESKGKGKKNGRVTERMVFYDGGIEKMKMRCESTRRWITSSYM